MREQIRRSLRKRWKAAHRGASRGGFAVPKCNFPHLGWFSAGMRPIIERRMPEDTRVEDLALIREAFGRALEMPSGEGQSLLAGLPAPVRSEVLSLLTAHQSAGAFLNTPEHGWLRIGERIGPYRMVQKIGPGGMGMVE